MNINWQPKNGEKVWIKIFSNWSSGTYIGLDEDGKTHIVRESNAGGNHLLSSKEILPIEFNPNREISMCNLHILEKKHSRIEEINPTGPNSKYHAEISIEFAISKLESALEISNHEISIMILQLQNELKIT